MTSEQLQSIQEKLDSVLNQANIDLYGYTHLQKPFSIDIYKEWINKNLYGDMEYLKNHIEQKENPQSLMPEAKSAIVIAKHYYPNHPYPKPELILKSFNTTNLKVAKYALGYDYHFWLKNIASEIALDLQKIFPNNKFLCFTDSSPVLERDLAYRAGLGWIGKNSCLINQKEGSLFLIAEIYTDIDLSKKTNSIAADRCGNCTRCIDACPTQAIQDNKTLDASRCISYLNIESKNNPPEELRGKISGWFFGCDICQEVCPWNEKAFGKESFHYPNSKNEDLIQDLKWILSSSNKQLEKHFKLSALSRANANNLKRNALMIVVHAKLKELIPDIEAIKTEKAQLIEIKEWALKKLAD